MPIYGDESGDCGTRPGASAIFSLGIAMFETVEAAASCRQKIAELKESSGVDEFHWVDRTDDERKRFLECIAQERFHYIVQTLNKRRSTQRRFGKKAFYNRVAQQLAKGIEEWLRLVQVRKSDGHLNCLVVLDQNNDDVYQTSNGNPPSIHQGPRRAITRRASAGTPFDRREPASIGRYDLRCSYSPAS